MRSLTPLLLEIIHTSIQLDEFKGLKKDLQQQWGISEQLASTVFRDTLTPLQPNSFFLVRRGLLQKQPPNRETRFIPDFQIQRLMKLYEVLSRSSKFAI